MKKIKAAITFLRERLDLKSFIGLVLLAVFIASSFSKPVLYCVKKVLPSEKVTITLYDSEDASSENLIWFLSGKGEDGDMYDKMVSSINLSEYTCILRRVEDGEPSNSLAFYGNNDNKQITFEFPVYSSSYLTLIRYNTSDGSIKVEASGEETIVNCKSETESDLIYIMPFKDNKTHFAITFALYVVLFFAILTALICIKLLFWDSFMKKCFAENRGKLLGYNKFIDTAILFTILLTVSLIQYFTGSIDSYLEYGDQLDYWVRIQTLSDLNYVVSFRGYLCYLMPYLFNTFGTAIGLDASVLWIIWLNILAAYLIGYVFPELSIQLNPSVSVSRVQVYLFGAVFWILFNGMLTAVLMDLSGFVFFITGFLFLIKAFKEKRIFCAALSSIGFAGSIMFRSAYMYGVMAIIIFECGHIVYKKFKSKDMTLFTPKNITICSIMLLMFLAVCVPELIINLNKGKFSLFPYDAEGVWISPDHTLMELSANQSLTYITGHPYLYPIDKQIAYMKYAYSTIEGVNFTFIQLLDMFITNPVDTLIYIIKKLLVGFDSRTPLSYPDGYTRSFLYSFLNYAVVFTGIWTIIKKKMNTQTKIICGVILGALILPQTFVHVEWRYFFSGYMLFMFLSTYYFLPDYFSNAAESDKSVSKIKKDYILLLPIFIILYATICYSLFAY